MPRGHERCRVSRFIFKFPIFNPEMSSWQWEDWSGKSNVKLHAAYTCRNFHAIQDWAQERVLAQYNPTVRIEDNIDIVIPVLQSENINMFEGST